MNRDQVQQHILLEMARCVGLNFDTYDEFKKWADEKGDGWYNSMMWSEDEQNSFAKWAEGEIRKHLRLRVKDARSHASWMLLMWGWRVHD